MDSIADFLSQKDRILELEQKNYPFVSAEIKKLKDAHELIIKKLEDKNALLTRKLETKKHLYYSLKESRDTLLNHRETKVNMLVGLFLKGALSISKYEIADMLFVDVAHINNKASLLKRAMVA